MIVSKLAETLNLTSDRVTLCQLNSSTVKSSYNCHMIEFSHAHTRVCVGWAYRHQQTHKDSWISISNPDDPLVVDDVVTNRRSYHPGTVVDCIPGSHPVAAHFEGQDDECSRQINRRECRKRPRVYFLLSHQRRHISFILVSVGPLPGFSSHNMITTRLSVRWPPGY